MAHHKDIQTMDPLGDGISSVYLVQHVGGDDSVVRAARVSHARDLSKSAPDRDKALIKFMLKHKHGSPFEHNLLTYRITAPLFVIQEMLRHRIGTSFNQESHRYVVVQNEAYIPRAFRAQSPSNRQASIVDEGMILQDQAIEAYKATVSTAYETYEKLLEMGVCREQARGVLPHSTYSSLYMTFNLRSLIHFLGLRLNADAQWEIQQYAKAFYTYARPLFPVTFDALHELEMLKNISVAGAAKEAQV